MDALAIPADLRLAAPDLGRRFGAILAALAALVARAFLKNPARIGVIVPLWTYLNRTARRFQRLTARLAAGRLPRNARPGRSGSRPVRLPRQYAWLVIDLRHEAAACRGHLEQLLADPAVKTLIETAPTAARLLRPLCRMLGLAPALLAPPPAPPPRAPASPAPPPHATRPPPLQPPRQGMPEPPCPRLRFRWPWYFNPAAKPA